MSIAARVRILEIQLVQINPGQTRDYPISFALQKLGNHRSDLDFLEADARGDDKESMIIAT